MEKKTDWVNKFSGEGVLFLTAIIWGSGFVAQRKAMDGMQPFAFVALRFLMGALVLLPILLIRKKKAQKEQSGKEQDKNSKGQNFFKDRVLPCLLAGFFLFGGTSLQQLGIMTTSAAKSGFLTSLYLVLVPIAGLFFGKKLNRWVWLGVVMAFAGIYFLSVGIDLSIQTGDLLLLLGSLFWVFQILTLDHYSTKMDGLRLAFGEFLTTSALAFIASLIFESGPMIKDPSAWLPLLYSGVVVVGIAFTLQVFGQSKVDPTLASLIMGLEAVFALIAGMIFLDERLTGREFLGSALLLAAVFLVQLKGQQKKEQPELIDKTSK